MKITLKEIKNIEQVKVGDFLVLKSEVNNCNIIRQIVRSITNEKQYYALDLESATIYSDGYSTVDELVEAYSKMNFFVGFVSIEDSEIMLKNINLVV